MDKQIVEYLYNEPLLSNIREQVIIPYEIYSYYDKQWYEYISESFCWAKEARHKIVHAAWFDSHEIPEKAN